jgi:hypothetical protein
MGNTASGASGESHMYPHLGADFYCRLNDNVSGGNFGGASPASVVGFQLGNRSTSTALQAYHNGSSFASQSVTSAAVISATMKILSMGGSSPTDQVAVATFGGSLDATNNSDFYTALNTNKWW